jgi:large repetitive protein
VTSNYTFAANLTCSAHGLKVGASNITINGGGYTIAGNGSTNNYGISSSNAGATRNNVTVTNLTLSNFYRGLQLQNFTGSTMSSLTISGMTESGIYFTSNSTGNTVSGSSISSSGYGGIQILGSGNTISNNSISSDTDDSHIYINSSSNNITGNTITNSVDQSGIYLDSSATSNTLSTNTITGTVASRATGISFASGASSNTFTGNTVSSNMVGVNFNSSASINTFTSNIFSGNQYAVYNQASSNVYTSNSFTNNIHDKTITFNTDSKLKRVVNGVVDFIFNMFTPAGSSCSSCSYSVSTTPTETVSSLKTGNQVTGSFTNTQTGAYVPTFTVTDSDSNVTTKTKNFTSQTSTQADQNEDYTLTTFIRDYEKLVIAKSSDGITWTEQESPFISGVRDPSIVQLDNGNYAVVYNDSSTGNINTVTLLTGGTMSNLSFAKYINITFDNGVTWAPEFFIDPGTRILYVFVASDKGGVGGDMKMWETHASQSDLTTWSTPTLVMDYPGFNVIDAYVVKKDSTYYMFHVVNVTGLTWNTYYSTSSSVTGPYTNRTQVLSTDNHEAPVVTYSPATGYRLYVDEIGDEVASYIQLNNDFTTNGSLTPYYMDGNVKTAHGTILLQTVPSAPTAVSAVVNNTQSVTVSFTDPVVQGGSAITGYTVTASPGGATATGSSSPVTIDGLSPQTAYTFTVKATNRMGTSNPSPSSSPVTIEVRSSRPRYSFSSMSDIATKPIDNNIPPSTNIPSSIIDSSGTIIYNIGTESLREGAKNNHVKELQKFLNTILSTNTKIDGVLGKNTVSLIKKWQKDNDLKPDGIVGTNTKTKMNSLNIKVKDVLVRVK